jgi:hypothetical protein
MALNFTDGSFTSEISGNSGFINKSGEEFFEE